MASCLANREGILMKKYFKRIFAASLALLAFCAIGTDTDCYAQSAVQTPVYVPSVSFPLGTYAATVSASTPTAAFSVQNQETMCLQLSGTYSGLASVVQGTTSPPSVAASSAVWTSIAVVAYPEDGVKLINIAQNGLYCFNTAGLRQIRLNVTAVTIGGSNSLVINASGTTAHKYVVSSVQRKATFSASGTTVPTTAGDMVVIAGNATTQTRINEISCSAGTIATTAITEVVSIIKRSTLGTGAATGTFTAVPSNSVNAAAGSTVSYFNTVPSPAGTPVGTVRVTATALPIALSSTASGGNFDFVFGTGETQELVLNSATENVAVNITTAGHAETWNCFVSWTER